MYKLSICAIAKNELDLPEWVCYNKVVGVDHIYIYDNDSVVPVKETLAKYIESGYVTCIDFPGLSKQMPSYNDCLARFGADSQWIAFIDCDEFMVPKKVDTVPEVLDQFSKCGSLQVNWILFGSSGQQKRPDGIVIENYTKSSPTGYQDNLHTKAIVQPTFTQQAGSNPHYFIMKRGYKSVNEKFEDVRGAFSSNHNSELIQINHYTNKSYQDFLAKMSKGRADAAHLPTANDNNFTKLDVACTEADKSIVRFIEPTKLAMLE